MISDVAWDEFVLYAKCLLYGSKDYNSVEYNQVAHKARGNTKVGNPDADIFDVFNFWREEILGGHAYSQEYLDGLEKQAIEEEKNAKLGRRKVSRRSSTSLK